MASIANPHSSPARARISPSRSPNNANYYNQEVHLDFTRQIYCPFVHVELQLLSCSWPGSAATWSAPVHEGQEFKVSQTEIKLSESIGSGVFWRWGKLGISAVQIRYCRLSRSKKTAWARISPSRSSNNSNYYNQEVHFDFTRPIHCLFLHVERQLLSCSWFGSAATWSAAVHEGQESKVSQTEMKLSASLGSSVCSAVQKTEKH